MSYPERVAQYVRKAPNDGISFFSKNPINSNGRNFPGFGKILVFEIGLTKALVVVQILFGNFPDRRMFLDGLENMVLSLETSLQEISRALLTYFTCLCDLDSEFS